MSNSASSVNCKFIDSSPLSILNLQCMNQPNGVVYLAGKKHYFGVGGGTRQFLSLLEKEGKLILYRRDYVSGTRIYSLPIE